VANALEISLTMVAAGTTLALGPTQAKQMFLTGFFGAEPFLKLHQAEGSLLHSLAPFSQLFWLIIPNPLEQRQ
jgi:hypothetical protein